MVATRFGFGTLAISGAPGSAPPIRRSSPAVVGPRFGSGSAAISGALAAACGMSNSSAIVDAARFESKLVAACAIVAIHDAKSPVAMNTAILLFMIVPPLRSRR
jgi:hypothetical protein